MSVNTVLQGHDLFGALSVKEMDKLSRFSASKQLSAGEVIFDYGKAASHTYMLMSGDVHLRLPAGPEEVKLVVSKVAKGELFGLSPLLDSPRYTLSAVCRDDVEVLSIEAKPFRELLRGNHDAGFNILNQVAHTYFTRYVEVLKRLQGVVTQVSQV